MPNFGRFGRSVSIWSIPVRVRWIRCLAEVSSTRRKPPACSPALSLRCRILHAHRLRQRRVNILDIAQQISISPPLSTATSAPLSSQWPPTLQCDACDVLTAQSALDKRHRHPPQRHPKRSAAATRPAQRAASHCRCAQPPFLSPRRKASELPGRWLHTALASLSLAPVFTPLQSPRQSLSHQWAHELDNRESACLQWPHL